MEQSVTVKSYPNGLNLIISEDASMERILDEITRKFDSARQFFGNSQVAISFDGKILNDDETREIVTTIQDHSDLHVACIVGKNNKLQLLYEDAIKQYEQYEALPLGLGIAAASKSHSKGGCNARIIAGTVKSGETLNSEHTLVILGDINPGGNVATQKDVIVMGSVLGEVTAGMDGKKGHYIMALDLQAERLKIGDLRYRKKSAAKGFFLGNAKKQPEIAVVKDEEIVLFPINKEVLGNEVYH